MRKTMRNEAVVERLPHAFAGRGRTPDASPGGAGNSRRVMVSDAVILAHTPLIFFPYRIRIKQNSCQMHGEKSTRGIACHVSSIIVWKADEDVW
jgi:hypothetical protein